MKRTSRRQIAARLAERFFVRFHMFLILAATFVAGMLATKALYALRVNILALRYTIAVCVAYLVFLGLILALVRRSGFADRLADRRSGHRGRHRT